MSGFSHFVHLILCILTGFLWIPVYVLCIICSGNTRKKKDRELMERQTKALEEMARIEKWRGYRD